MTALLGLLGPASEDDYDAYGVASAAAWNLPIDFTTAFLLSDTTDPTTKQIGQLHLMIALKNGTASIDVDEISFDSSNIVSKHWVTGHPNVVGLRLSRSTVSRTFGHPVQPTALDMTKYVVPQP
jgi:hypothetical protein